MLQLWTISNLQRLDYSIRKKVRFYAPLTEHLDFYGVDPVIYTHSGGGQTTYRGGIKNVTPNMPIFYFGGDTPYGIYVAAGITLQFAAANGLNDASTLVWFESRIPKSTPTNAPPFDANGKWIGTNAVYISHVCKADSVLANSEINAIQLALLDTFQSLPTLPPIEASPGSPVTETPSGARNGINKVFTLSQTPDLGSLEVFWGGLYLKRVSSGPDTLEYTATGAGNRTLTLGSAPQSSEDLTANYWTPPPS